MILVLCPFAWTLTALAEQMPAPRGELRIVDKRWSNRFSIENHVIASLVEIGPNGTLVPAASFGYDPTLPPYPFDADKARRLLTEAGYADRLSLLLIAPTSLEVQATVVSKMLEQGGFWVELRVLTRDAFNRQTLLTYLDQPPEHQAWNIALTSRRDRGNFPVYLFYYLHALDGYNDWVSEQVTLRQLYEQTLGTVGRERQQAVMHQMERHTHEQAYFLFLYNPIQLYTVNKAVEFVPYITGDLILAETGVTAEHWSIRKQKADVHK
jgi:peptide/nickel transport system substrate-binding protein